MRSLVEYLLIVALVLLLGLLVMRSVIVKPFLDLVDHASDQITHLGD